MIDLVDLASVLLLDFNSLAPAHRDLLRILLTPGCRAKHDDLASVTTFSAGAQSIVIADAELEQLMGGN